MFMSLSTVLNNNKNLKNGGAYWNRGAYLQKHVLWGALIRKGALIGRRALNRIITVSMLESFQTSEDCIAFEFQFAVILHLVISSCKTEIH